MTLKRGKYGNIRCTTPTGEKFDSKSERRRWFELLLLEKAGQISDIKRQVVFQVEVNGELIGRVIPDFSYIDNATGQRVYEDVKGGEEGKATMTPLTRWQHKLLHAIYGIQVRIVSA